MRYRGNWLIDAHFLALALRDTHSSFSPGPTQTGKWVSSVYRSNHETQDPRSFDREMIIGKMHRPGRPIASQLPAPPRVKPVIRAKRTKCQVRQGNIDEPCAGLGEGNTSQPYLEMHRAPPSFELLLLFFFFVLRVFVFFFYRFIITRVLKLFMINFNNNIYYQINVTNE